MISPLTRRRALAALAALALAGCGRGDAPEVRGPALVFFFTDP